MYGTQVDWTEVGGNTVSPTPVFILVSSLTKRIPRVITSTSGIKTITTVTLTLTHALLKTFQTLHLWNRQETTSS